MRVCWFLGDEFCGLLALDFAEFAFLWWCLKRLFCTLEFVWVRVVLSSCSCTRVIHHFGIKEELPCVWTLKVDTEPTIVNKVGDGKRRKISKGVLASPH